MVMWKAHLISALLIALSPLVWNTLARMEYRTQFISKKAGARLGCYMLAAWIFMSSLYRDIWFEAALNEQSLAFSFPVGDSLLYFAYALMAAGSVLVLSSYYKLGITGTFLGDYFGILMSERVTSFPFNVSEHPMYHGASLIFVGKALARGSASGLALAAWAFIVYTIAAEFFEGPFTTDIYENAASAGRRGGTKRGARTQSRSPAAVRGAKGRATKQAAAPSTDSDEAYMSWSDGGSTVDHESSAEELLGISRR